MAEPRWLTDVEQRAWRALVESSRALFEALDRELQRDADMPHTYFEVLVRLSEAPERSLRMSELADLTLSSRSRLSHAVARLEERGWVERRNCETDRRGQVATLTDAGFAVLRDAAPGHVAAVRRYVVDALDPAQLAALTEIGETIRARVEGDG
ncbi:MarR family winged helix-turn-helix transcriptional regulator [Jatrophihabitans endophyticus]|uniref:MarR family winged helix-turn-helix transcriptional regulator n=1 Tax=Jatrophihabitans endophyticus TaxID=1206085 RepID=UPI0019DC6502|nr:MarR family transcriptional regulator [Jatrophihabitans endophyticus]MBE7190251.1 MarR family transcriptional regulator [Jatrophihabitans endophyticus]